MEEEGLKQEDLRQRGGEAEREQAWMEERYLLFLDSWRSPRLGWEGGAQVRKLWSQSSPVHIHSAGRLLGTSGGPGPSTHLSLTNGSLLKLCKPGATRPPPPHLLSKLTIPRITKELPGFRKLVLNHRAGLLGPPYVRPHG